MLNLVSVVLDRPITSAQVCGIEDSDEQVQQVASDQMKSMVDAEMQKIEAEKKHIAELLSAVEAAATELDDLRKRAVTENKQQIGLLAVEIARKILVSEIEEGKYDIGAMIEKALQASPSREGATVRLNPHDLDKLEEIIKSGSVNFENVKFEADSSIGPAQCFVATSKGIVEYFIDDQLNRIGSALGSN